ncbi:MAG: TolC family protein [Nitrospirota bacterium]
MKPFIFSIVVAVILIPFRGHGMTLEEGITRILTNGRDIKISRSDENVARAAVSVPRSALFPHIDLYANQTWLQYQPQAKFGSQIVPTSDDNFITYGVRATQLLFDFGKTLSSVEAAKYSLQAREISTRRTQNRTILEFIISYCNLLEAEKQLQVATEDTRRYEGHKKDAEARFKSGVATRNEVLQADVRLADSRQRQLTADNQRSLRISRINSLLARSLNEPLYPVEIEKNLFPSLTLDEAWKTALAASPEIKILDAEISGKEEAIKTVRAEYWPNFFLQGGYQYQENPYMVHQHNWSVIAGVNLNLWSGGATSARISMNRGQLQSLKFTREKIMDAVQLDVKNAHLDLESSIQKIDVMKTSVAQAEENLRLQQLRYREGVGTALEVLDAVTLVSTAQTNWWKARYDAVRAEASLWYAMGKELVTLYGTR